MSKRLELLKELVPGLTRVVVLWDAEGLSKVLEFARMPSGQAAAQGLTSIPRRTTH